MNVLDENIPAGQRCQLENWRIRSRQIAAHLGWRGMQDEEVLSLLRQLRRPTFFTRDDDFFDRHWCDRKYGLIHLAVERDEVAQFVRRTLKHPQLSTQAKRMGAAVRVSSAGLLVWRIHAQRQIAFAWTEK